MKMKRKATDWEKIFSKPDKGLATRIYKKTSTTQ